MLPRKGLNAAQADMVKFIYINRAALREIYEPDEEAGEDELLSREEDLMSQAQGGFDDSMREAQLQAMDDTDSEADAEYKSALVPTA